MGRPTVAQVLALAPDSRSPESAAALATPGPWSDTGCDERAVWGTCRGRASAPYRVACDLRGPAFRCTCPSRRFPCKHALALLLLWARRSPLITPGAPGPEVAAWLAGRTAGGDGWPDVSSPDTGKPGDTATEAGRGPAAVRSGAVAPEGADARNERRVARIVAGMDELDRWLGDLIRHGLGDAPARPYRFWDAMAARLVDAQAPGAAARVRDLPGVVHRGDGWPARLLARLGRLHLLAAGWRRYRSLPEPVRADLRTAAGWPWPSAVVLAGATEEDRWYVLARRVTEEEQVRAQRTWLWGLGSGRPAVVVDFARPGATFTWDLWPGNVVPARLARFPGSAPLRVLVAERLGEPAAGGAPPAWDDLAGLASARGRAFAADPWLERWPVSVTGVVPERGPDGWVVTDRAGRVADLAVSDAAGWPLLAVSGGRAVHLLGEWDGDGITPLGVWAEDRMVVL